MRNQGIIILGNHVQALGLIRMAGQIGMSVSLFNNSKVSIARHSKYCNSFHFFRNEDELFEMLVVNPVKDWESNPILIATNDKLVSFIISNFHELGKHYRLLYSDPESVEKCLDKRRTYTIASGIGIPIPDTFFPKSHAELIDLSKGLIYPVILKPAFMHHLHPVTGIKAILCKDESELILQFANLINFIPFEEIMIQSFISSGPSHLYSMGCVANKGRIVKGFIANRTRQHPMIFGNSTCYAKTQHIEKIKKQSERILAELDYSGLCEVEFIFDEPSNQYMLLEINPRAWKWHSLAEKLGLNYLNEILSFRENQEISHFQYEDDIVWIEPITDLYVSAKEILRGNMNLKSYARSLKYKKQNAVFCRKDILPGIMYVLMLPILIFKR